MRVGLRLKLLLSLGSLLVLAFVPLFFAVAGLTRATLTSVRASSARSLGRAIAAHVMEAERARGPGDLEPLLDAQLGPEGVAAIGLYDREGRLVAHAALEGAEPLLPAQTNAAHEELKQVATPRGPALLVLVPSADGRGSVAALLRTDASTMPTAPLVHLVGLYTGVVALALLVFAYFAMTRLVVRPVAALERAAGRVADGARKLDVPRSGTRELDDLASSVVTMTARLRADEESLRDKVAALERATNELRAAQDRLVRSERLASVGRLAAGLAHEIGNPIAAILGFQELLLAGDLEEDEARDFLARMKKETERVHRILRDLLDFARPAVADGAARSGEPGEVSAAVDDALALVRPQKAFRDVDVEVAIARGLPHVALSHERIVQVVLNLLLNAADVVPKHGGKVWVRASDCGEHAVRIEVEDNGPGIDASVRDRLFEPFVTTKEVGKGTGLGLAVCRGLVEAVGGTIAVEDGAEGARFVLELPGVGAAEGE